MRFRELLRLLFWSQRARRIATRLAVVYLLVLLVPFAVIGETWGMVWYYLAWPSSEAAKFLWDELGAVPYVGIATIVNGMLAFQVLYFLFWLIGRTNRPTPEPGELAR